MAMATDNTSGLKHVSPTLTVWEEDRDVGMLAAGLELEKTAKNKTLELDNTREPTKRRTLDDMRRLSAHIKNENRRK